MSFSFEAPEMITSEEFDLEPTDIFATGILLFMMRAGSRPFLHATKTDTYYRQIYSGKAANFWKLHSKSKPSDDFFSEDFKQLVEGMLQADPKKRFTIENIKSSNWYQGETADKTAIEEEIKKLQKLVKEFYRTENEIRRLEREKAKKKETEAQIDKAAFSGFKVYRGSEDV